MADQQQVIPVCGEPDKEEVSSSSLVEIDVSSGSSIIEEALELGPSGSWSLKISAKEVTGDNPSKRRRRHSRRAGGRRRGQHLQYSTSHDPEDIAPARILDLITTHPNLPSLQSLTICDLEDAVPINSLCLLLNSATNLEELTLDNVILYGDLKEELQNSTCLPDLKKISLCSCGPREDIFLQWLMQQTKSTLQELSLHQMLLSQSTFERIPQLSSLIKLQLKSTPCLHHLSNLGKISSLVELHLGDPVSTDWFTEKQQHWSHSSTLQTLSLALYDSPTLQEMGQFVAGTLRRFQESLCHLSVRFVRPEVVLRGGSSSMMSNFLTSFVQPLHRTPCLESLQVYFPFDNGGKDPVTRVSSLESVLTHSNTSLSKLVVASSQQTVQFPPTVDFWLGLNGAGRKEWLTQDQICPQVLASAWTVFPSNEAYQLSMIYYILSHHPSWMGK